MLCDGGQPVALIVMANEGTPIMLNYVLQRVANNYTDWLCMLWSNSSLSPSPTTVYANLTEATFTGYARRTIDHTKWQAPTIIGSVKAQSLYDTVPLSWTNTGSIQDVYGYAIITPSAFKILWSQKLDAPISIATGGTIQFQPAMELGTEP